MTAQDLGTQRQAIAVARTVFEDAKMVVDEYRRALRERRGGAA